MPTQRSDAVVILHEIYGINAHIHRTREMWRARGFDVYVPALFPHDAPYSYAQQDEAYRYFSNHLGFDPQPILTLLTTLRAQHRKLIVIGYSTGATLAWRVAGSGLCDGVICHYGSRIRQYSDELPHCPALMIMARHEPSFDPTALQQKLETLPLVQCHMYDAQHGFCDADSPGYLAWQARHAVADAIAFVDAVCG